MNLKAAIEAQHIGQTELTIPGRVEPMYIPPIPEAEGSSLAQRICFRLQKGWDFNANQGFWGADSDQVIDLAIEQAFCGNAAKDDNSAEGSSNEAIDIFDTMMMITADLRTATDYDTNTVFFDPKALDTFFVDCLGSEPWDELKYSFSPALTDNSKLVQDARREEMAATILLKSLDSKYNGTDVEKYLAKYIEDRTKLLLSWQFREVTQFADLSRMSLRDGINVLEMVLFAIGLFAEGAKYPGYEDAWKRLSNAFSKENVHARRPDLIFSKIRTTAESARSRLLHRNFKGKRLITPLETFDETKTVSDIVASRSTFKDMGLMDDIAPDREIKVTAIEDPFFSLELYDDGQGNYWILLSAFSYRVNTAPGKIDVREAVRRDLYVARLGRNSIVGNYRLPVIYGTAKHRRAVAPKIARARQEKAS